VRDSPSLSAFTRDLTGNKEKEGGGGGSSHAHYLFEAISAKCAGE
jgi:hypothetical protein